MADIQPVYDLFCPSPVPLKDLASIELALDLWQREIRKHRVNKTLHKWKNISNASAKILIPNLSQTHASDIDKYVGKIVRSIDCWFKYYRSVDYTILNHFDDFVCDFDGSIHGERSARRMLLCDGIDDESKFEIACLYCLEEDIVTLWPSVSSRMLLSRISFQKHCELYYWVARLKNQLYKVPRGPCTIGGVMIGPMPCRMPPPPNHFTNSLNFSPQRNVELSKMPRVGDSVETALLGVCRVWSATKYFMDRLDLPLEDSVGLIDLFRCDMAVFCRYIVPKLVANKGLLANVLSREPLWFDRLMCSNLRGVTAVWSVIKDTITPDGFSRMIQHALFRLTDGSSTDVIDDSSPLVELWNSASDHLKQFIIERNLLHGERFKGFLNPMAFYRQDMYQHLPRDLSLLLAILSYAPAEIRKQFWNLHWRNLIVGIRYDDLQAMMESCIGDQAAIAEFKQMVLSEYINVRPVCSVFLRKARFSEIDEYLTFCGLSEQSMMDFKKRLLAEDHLVLELELLENASLFKEFIYKSYNDVDAGRAHDYIVGLLLSSNATETLKQYVIREGRFQPVMQFIDTIAPSNDFAARLKRDELLPALRMKLDQYDYFCFMKCDDDVGEFIAWCMKDESEIARFKQQINLDELVQGLLRSQSHQSEEYRNASRGMLASNCVIVQVMKWYLGTDQAFDEFKRKYAEDELFVEWFGM